MLYCFLFTDMEDSATLGNDKITILGLMEAVHYVLAFSYASGGNLTAS